MADYDDAESPVYDEQGRSRAVSRAHGPIGKAIAWFGHLPTRTKVIVVGVAVVLGVVVYMALRKRSASDDDVKADTSEIPTKPLPTGPGGPMPPIFPPIPLGGGYQPGPQPAPAPPGANDSGPTGIASQPSAAPAVARWRVTPGGVSQPYLNYDVNSAGHRQGIAITGPLSSN